MKRLAGFFLVLGLMTQGAWAQEAQTEMTDEEYAHSFVINNTVYTIYHEIGHLLIGELGIPVLAKEEDAADNLATLLLLSAETVEADNALIDAVDAYFITEEQNADAPIEDAELYDVHSLDTQRAFQIVCLAVGADPETFAQLAEESGLDSDRQENCAFDFAQTGESWNAVLKPHLNDGSQKPEITISYDATDTYSVVADMLRGEEVLEYVTTNILAHYKLPRPVRLTATECGEENAFYDPEAGEITMCYELAELYLTQANSYSE